MSLDRPPGGVDPTCTNWIDPPVSWIDPPLCGFHLGPGYRRCLGLTYASCAARVMFFALYTPHVRGYTHTHISKASKTLKKVDPVKKNNFYRRKLCFSKRPIFWNSCCFDKFDHARTTSVRFHFRHMWQPQHVNFQNQSR